MPLVLTVLSGPREGAEFRAGGADSLTIGRSEGTDIRVMDVTMSRVHAVVTRDDDGWWIEDQESRNGVWLEGRRVQRHRLKDGDILRLGKITEIMAALPDSGADMEPPPTATCTGCGDEVDPDDIARGGDGNSYHVECRGMTHLIGEDFGGYRVSEALSACGPGHRLRGRDMSLDRDVALRVFDAAAAARPGFGEALDEAVRDASKLVHPHVVQVLDRGEQDDLAFVVEEAASGTALFDLLSARRFLPARDAANVASQVLAGLAHVVEHGVARPHLSSRRILIGEEFTTKVVWLADPLAPAEELADEEAGLVAPEAALGADVGEEIALVYGVGALLYRMLTGITPSDGDNAEQAAERAMRVPAAEVRRINLKVSPALERAVHDAIEADPRGRVPTLNEFREALLRAI